MTTQVSSKQFPAGLHWRLLITAKTVQISTLCSLNLNFLVYKDMLSIALKLVSLFIDLFSSDCAPNLLNSNILPYNTNILVI